MKLFIVFLLLATISHPIFSQKKKIKNDSICWTEDAKLKWSDFTGKPRNVKATYADMKAFAFTYTNITAKGEIVNDLPQFTILCRFVKAQSWVADTTMAYILRHEQLHFDIAELYGRKIRQALSELVKKREKGMNKYSDLINNNLDDLEKRNHEFDQKTIHGIADPQEKEWEKTIAKELAALKEFKSTKAICP